jgi:hypothetical protein
MIDIAILILSGYSFGQYIADLDRFTFVGRCIIAIPCIVLFVHLFTTINPFLNITIKLFIIGALSIYIWRTR